MEPTPLPVRTPVSQQHYRRDPDLHVELATAAREVVTNLYGAVKLPVVAGIRERAAYTRVTVLPSSKGVWGGQVDLSIRTPRIGRVQQRERTRVRAGRFDPAIVAVFAAAVSAPGAARPSLWFDEAATISASTRSVPELWRLIHNIDV